MGSVSAKRQVFGVEIWVFVTIPLHLRGHLEQYAVLQQLWEGDYDMCQGYFVYRRVQEADWYLCKLSWYLYDYGTKEATFVAAGIESGQKRESDGLHCRNATFWIYL